MAGNASAQKLTYTVTVPAATKDCFIAGDMNAWTPHEMVKTGSNKYQLSVAEAQISQHYIYLSGPAFTFAETIPSNRTYKLADTVNGWKNIWNPAEGRPVNVALGSAKSYFFHSKIVDSRNIEVWLPDGYSPRQKYNVVYMHDGQMLFDSTTTWNRKEWQVDEVVGKLIASGQLKQTIIVGIDNNGNKREAEFFPQKVVGNIPQPQQSDLLKLMPGGPIADSYLRFIAEELKPYIDTHYSTYKDAGHTFIGGSSLGGMISLYAVCEYPNVFSGAFCMSTHWVGTFYQNSQIPYAYLQYLDKHIPAHQTHKLYFDHGDQTLDSLYAPAQAKVDALFKAKGYNDRNFKSLIFPGVAHIESDWAKRLGIPFLFLLGKE
jgi:enterochelin esterase-like enzyme